MSKALLTARLGAGATQGFSTAIQYERDRPMRDLRLQQAELAQKQAESQFEDYQENEPVRDAQRTQAIAQAQQGAYQANVDVMRSQTYDAFRRFQADNDVKHLNTFLKEAKQNPIGRNVYGDYTRVDSIGNLDTQEAQQLLRKAGYPEPAETLSDPDMQNEFVVATGQDGSRTLLQMSQLYASTGYTQRMTQQELDQAQQKAQIAQLEKYPNSAESQIIRDIAKENNITLLQAAQKYKAVTKSRNAGSTVERTAKAIRQSNPWMSEEQSLREAAILLKSGGTASEREAYDKVEPEPGEEGYLENLDEVNKRKERTSQIKNADEAMATREKIDELAGGDYFELDLTKPENRRKVGPQIRRLEQLTNSELTTEDKRVARNIRDLISLGKTAGDKLTSEETGLLDHMFGKVKRYFSDNVKGEEARASYETFRNVFRNALYGASLTDNEIKTFESAAGSLSQQAGPVLKQLQVQMESLRNQLQSIYNMNDEYVAQYYVGTDLETLDRAIEGIEERVQLIQGSVQSAPKNSNELPRVPIPKESTRSDEEAEARLGDLFGGSE
jgi:hypothetical protein